ncbi:MAG: thioredoxin family protein [Epsilonproteobacteria bacterium]|nr:thioredoxin family protein [Campylobacterota bacterium]
MLKQLILLWLLTPTTYANHVHWMGDYDKALQLAYKEDKPLVVLVVKKDSKMCNKILHQQFMHQPYIDTINDKMIAVMVTYEGKLSYPIEMYYTTVFPTLFFVDTKSETFMKEPLYGELISQKVLLQYFQPYLSKTK